jgi:hypothetical protein
LEVKEKEMSIKRLTKQDEAAVAKARLREIDIASIGSIREYIVAKPDAPKFLKDYEAAAAAEREKLKPKA